MQLLTQNLQPLSFVQGDDAALTLAVVDSEGNPVDITGASFSTQILGANGVGPVTFPDNQHVITDAALGYFDLGLTESDTPTCGLGEHKQILTTITIAGVMTTARGVNILTVYPSVPIQ